MAQIRVYLEAATQHTEHLTNLKFRWCSKDQRWEKTASDYDVIIQITQALRQVLPPDTRIDVVDKKTPPATEQPPG